MKKMRKTISTLLLMVFISALFFQNAAYGEPIETLGGIEQLVNELTWTISKNLVKDGDEIRIKASPGNSVIKPSYMRLLYEVEGIEGYELPLWLNYNVDGAMEASYNINTFDVAGVHTLKSIHVSTPEQGSFTIYPIGTENAEYTMDFSALSFEIEGTIGADFPEITLNVENKEYNPGDTLTVEASVSEEPISVSSLTVYLRDEFYNAIPINVTMGPDGGGFRGTYVIPSYIRSGRYSIDHVGIQYESHIIDIRNEQSGAWRTQDFSDVTFSVAGTMEDKAPPTLNKVEISSDSMGFEDFIEIKVYAEDDTAGIKSGFIFVQDETGTNHQIDLEQADGFWVARIDQSRNLRKGSYILNRVELYDQLNKNSYYEHTDDLEKIVEGSSFKDFSSYYFTITESVMEYIPEFSIDIAKKTATIGEQVVIKVSIDQSKIQTTLTSISLRTPSNEGNQVHEIQEVEPGVFEGVFNVHPITENGTYEVSEFHLSGEQLNKVIFNKKYYEDYMDAVEMTNSSFEVSGTLHDYSPNFVLNINQSSYNVGETISAELDLKEDHRLFDSIQAVFKNLRSEEYRTIQIRFTYDEEKGKYTASNKLGGYFTDGEYDLEYLEFNINNYYHQIYNSRYREEGHQEFPEIPFTLQGFLGGKQLLETSIDKTTIGSGEEFSVTLKSIIPDFLIKSATLYYKHKTNDAARSMSLWGSYVESGEGTYTIKSTINPYAAPGEYEIENIQIQTNYGHFYIINSAANDWNSDHKQDFSNLDIKIEGTTFDGKKPVLEAIQVIDSIGTPRQPIKVEVKATDDLSGLGGMRLHYKNGDKTFTIEGTPTGDFLTGEFKPHLNLDNGIYELYHIELWDKAQNSVTYANEKYKDQYQYEAKFMDFSEYSVELQDLYGSINPEVKVSIDKSVLRSGETLKVEASVDESIETFDRVEVFYRNTEKDTYSYMNLVKNDAGKFTGEKHIGYFQKEGLYEIREITLIKQNQPVITIYNSAYQLDYQPDTKQDFSSGNFEVVETLAEYKPEITIAASKPLYKLNDQGTLQLSIKDAPLQFAQIVGTFTVVKDGKEYSEEHYFYYDETTKRYNSNFTATNEMISGEHRLTKVRYMENHNWDEGSYTELEYDMPVFTIAGTLGGYQPAISAVINQKKAVPGDTIELTFNIAEDVVKYFGGRVQFDIMTDQGTRYENYDLIKTGNGKFKVVIPITKYEHAGIFNLKMIELRGIDYSQYIYQKDYYYDSWYEEDFSDIFFEVSGTTPDITPPKLQEIAIQNRNIVLGQRNELEISILEEGEGLEYGYLVFRNTKTGREHYTYAYGDTYKDGIAKTNFSSYEVGTYELIRVELLDKNGNWSTVYGLGETLYGEEMDFSGYTIEVGLPILQDVKIQITKNTLKPREYLHVFGQVPVDLAVDSYLYLEYETPEGGLERKYASLDSNGNFETYEEIFVNTPPGEYKLQGIYLEKEGITYRITHGDPEISEENQDLSVGNYVITGTILDFEGPVFMAARLNSTNIKQGETLELTVQARDYGVGVQSAEATVFHPETGEEAYIWLERSGAEVLKGSLYIDSSMAPGEWKVKSLYLYDTAFNSSFYFNKLLLPIYYGEPADFSAADYNVLETIKDTEAPELISHHLLKNSITALDEFEIHVEAIDSLSSVTEVMVTYENEEGQEYVFMAEETSPEYFVIKERMPENTSMKYTARKIVLVDEYGNSFGLLSEVNPGTDHDYDAMDMADLSDMDLTVEEVKMNNTENYIYHFQRPSRGTYEFGYGFNFRVEGGPEAFNLQKITAHLGFGEGDTAEIPLDLNEGEEGRKVYEGVFNEEHEGYQGGNTYTLQFLTLHFEDGTTEEIYTPWNAVTENILLIDRQPFTILEPVVIPVPPTVLGLTFEEKTIGRDERIAFQLMLSEDSTPVYSYEVYFRVDGEESSEKLRILNMEKQNFFADLYTVNGEYTIDRLVVYGEENVTLYNETYYPTNPNRTSFGKQAFTVRGTVGDKTAPSFGEVSVSSTELKSGERQKFTVSASDMESGLDYGMLYLEDPKGVVLTERPIYLLMDDDGKLSGTYTIFDTTLSGTYKISFVDIYDKALNVKRVNNFRSSGEIMSHSEIVDLSSYDFTVDAAMVDDVAPVFKGFVFDEESVYPGGSKGIYIDAEDEGSGLKSIKLNYVISGKERVLESTISMVDGKPYAILKFDPALQGEWRLRRIEVKDHLGNATNLFHSTTSTQSNMMNLTFGFYTLNEVAEEPEITNFVLDQETGMPGSLINITSAFNFHKIVPEKVTAVFKHTEENVTLEAALSMDGVKEYKGTLNISPYTLDGSWILDHVLVLNQFGETVNMEVKNTPWSKAGFKVESTTPDIDAPELEDIGLTKAEPVTMARAFRTMMNFFTKTQEDSGFKVGDRISLKVTANDEVSGVRKITLLYNVYGQKVRIEEELSKSSGNQYSAQFELLAHHPGGEWRLEEVTLVDDAGNETVLAQDPITGFVPGYSKLNFTVNGGVTDFNPPVIGNASVSGKLALYEDQLLYTIEASDVDSGIGEVLLRVQGEKSSVGRNVLMTEVKPGIFEGVLTITKDMPLDIYRVEKITARDLLGNESVVTNSMSSIGTFETRRDLSSTRTLLRDVVSVELGERHKTEYLLGDTFEGKITVVVTYTDETSEEIELTGDDISNPDMEILGTQKVEVRYKEWDLSYDIVITEPYVSRVHITSLPKTAYLVGEELDLNGLKVEVIYENGYERVLNTEEYKVSGFDGEKPGEQTITITYKDLFATYVVTVKEPTVPEEPEQPEEPGKPDPEEPEQPEEPGEPDPEKPEQPEEPGKPDPEEPEQPEEPGKPDPEEPEQPEEPGKPDPEEPEQPEEPGEPDPEEPEQPEEPGKPNPEEPTDDNQIVVDNNSSTIIETLNNSKNNAVVTVNATENKLLEKTVFQALMGTERTLVVETENAIWTFNGKDIKEAKDIDLTVKIASVDRSTTKNKASIKKLVKSEDVLILTFASNGVLPGEAMVRIKLDADWLEGKNKDQLYVYYFNTKTQKAEVVAKKLKVDKDGYIEFTVDHNSDFFVADKDLQKAAILPQTGSQSDSIFVFGGAVVLLFGLIFTRKKKSHI